MVPPTVNSFEPVVNRPLVPMMPASSPAAMASTSPLPQMPRGSTSPITVHSISLWFRKTREIAPVAARMPILMEPASKALPAAVEAHRTLSRFPSEISPLVPKSIRARNSVPVCRPTATMPARMSDPTNPPMQGRKRTIAEAGSRQPKSLATNCCSPRLGEANGTWVSGSVSSPQNR